MSMYRKLTTVAAVAALGLGLAACGGGGGSDTADTMPPVVEPEPTPYEVASAAIAAAGTEAAVDAALAAAEAAGITVAQLRSLEMAGAARKMALATAAAAAERQMLVTAAECTAATAECLMAHNALIAALQADVDALADDETATNAQQAAAQMALDDAEADRDAVQMAINEIDRTTVAGREVGEAMDLAAGLETDRSAEAIAAAKVAIEEAEEAVGDDDSYDERIAMAKRYVARAEEWNTVDAAVMAAEAAARGLADESGVDAVTAAQGLIDAANMVIEEAEHLTDAEKKSETAKVAAAQGTVTVAKNRNDDEAERIRLAMEEEQRKADEEAAKARSATAKALKAAIDIAKLDASDTATNVSDPTMIPVLDGDGLTATTGDDTGVIPLKKGDAVGSLGSWKGTDYAGMEAATGAPAKNTGMVRVYSNQGAPKSVTFASEDGIAVHGWQLATAPADVNDDYAVITTTPAQQRNVGGFPTTGTTDYDNEDTVSGTFMGASGTYTCVATAGCDSIVTADGINLPTAEWTFKPAPGAVLQQADDRYLQFGWWVRKDKDGPTHAGAFHRVVTPTDTPLVALTDAVINNAALVGKASYAGAAAGKFAISDPLRAAHDNSGHFTANAKLDADFKVTGSTLSGMIDGFRLNDGSDDPGWSVELQKAGFNTPNFGTNDTDDDDQTVWSINGAKSPASGAWQAQMFDENANDDSNVPTSVVGSFNSTIGTTHTMVGAFGAEKQ